MEELSIDLRSNPLVSRFFLGWSTQRAVAFAQNLLVIGIGVAKQLLNNNTPEVAYHKLLKMSENVMNEYHVENPIDSANQMKADTDMQGQIFSEPQEARSRKKQFRNTQQQESFNFEQESYSGQAEAESAAAERKKAILSQEISKVKKKLELINQKLNSQPLWEKAGNKFQQNSITHSQLDDTNGNEEFNQIMSPSMSRGRQRQSRLNSPVTPKITSSPPPRNIGNMGINSLANSRSHLNDEGIKQCMNIDTRDNEGEFSGGFTHFSKVYSETKNQYLPGYNQDNLMQKQPLQERRSPREQHQQKYNTEAFSRDDFIHKPNPSKLQKKKKQSFYQTQQLESNSKKNSHYMHVESRIKNEIKISRGQHQQTAGKKGANNNNNEEESQDDFKQMMIKGKKEQDQITKTKMEAQKQTQQKSDIAMEMGVQFSRDAQKRFYEKQELERQKQEKKRELAEMKKQQTPAQLQTYAIHYNAAQQQQFFKKLDAIGQYNFDSEQQLQNQRDGKIEPCVQAIPSMQTTLQGNNSSHRQNLLDIANSFLQSPLMNQINDDNRQEAYMPNYQVKSYGDVQSGDKTNSQFYPYGLVNPMSDGQTAAYPIPSQSVSQEQFYGNDSLAPPSGYSLGGFTQSFNPEQTHGGQQFIDRNVSNLASNRQSQLNSQNFMRSGEDTGRKGERLVKRDRLTGQEVKQNYDETNGKYEDFFRESISNSDFTLPNEEIQQFFKNQIFNPK